MTAAHRHYLLALNLMLHGIHLVLIGFSLVGWMFCEIRLLNLVALLLILFSWYGLGPMLSKGSPWGYCVITDIQWRIRSELGLESRSGGYIKYLADTLIGGDFDETRLDIFSVVIIFSCFVASVATNWLYGSCPSVTS